MWGQVTRDAVDNNRGIAIAKSHVWVLVLMKKQNGENLLQEWINNPEEWYTQLKKDSTRCFVSDCYVGCSDLIKNDTTGEVENIVHKW